MKAGFDMIGSGANWLRMKNDQTKTMPHIVPDSFEVTRDKATGEQVRLSFFQGDEGFHAVLPTNQIGLFAANVLNEARVSLTGPVDPKELELGGVVAPLGREIRKLPDGGVLLTIHLQTDDGVRSLPLRLSAEDTMQFAKDLTDA